VVVVRELMLSDVGVIPDRHDIRDPLVITQSTHVFGSRRA
jgi:hypothetical protein